MFEIPRQCLGEEQGYPRSHTFRPSARLIATSDTMSVYEWSIFSVSAAFTVNVATCAGILVSLLVRCSHQTPGLGAVLLPVTPNFPWFSFPASTGAQLGDLYIF